MVGRMIRWALDQPLIVLLLAGVLLAAGGYAFFHINVEAYPDPAPPIIEVIAQNPGASAEEMERLVTTPLEVTLAGMPGLQTTRSKSLFGLSHLRNQFQYGVDYRSARQEVINRLQFTQALPQGVVPQISPESPTGEIFRYWLPSPKDSLGRNVYTLADLKSLQDWTLERELRRIPRIADITSFGGTVKRYELHPDPDRLRRYGITLGQLQAAVANSNANVGGDYLFQGPVVQNVRGIGLVGGGLDPMQSPQLFAAQGPPAAAEFLRSEENRRLAELRSIVITSVNNHPIRVDDVVQGGPLADPRQIGARGAVVGHQTRLGQVAVCRPRRDAEGRELLDADGNRRWLDEDDAVQSIVLLRQHEDSLPALHDVQQQVKELNENPGRLLPGVRIEPYYDRTELIGVTTETVRENLLTGIALVVLVLLMFLSNVRTALIVAVNIPLALLFAFAALYWRGRSANLLSIGAVDFGIIVDSSVIMVENIYRHLAGSRDSDLPLKQRILRATAEIDRPLLFSTVIIVCAFIPLFTMRGPEGQLFGPMAETYAFALSGGLLLAVLLSPVLCLLLLRRLGPTRENFMVRWLKAGYLRHLRVCLKHRLWSLVALGGLAAATAVVMPYVGREFMPELEEGNLWIRGELPVNIALPETTKITRAARAVMQRYPEVGTIVSQVGRPDDGTDTSGFNNMEFFVPLRPQREWPAVKPRSGWARLFGLRRPRSKPELIDDMGNELSSLVGVDWNFSQNIRDNVMESLSGIKGDNSVKIIGPDLDELERLADAVQKVLGGVPGVQEVGVFRIKGQPNLEFPVDRQKCQRWGVSVTDVLNVIQTAVAGKAVTQMIEGEKTFDVALRWPAALRSSVQTILAIPVDLANNQTTAGYVPSTPATPHTGAASGISTVGSSVALPATTGSQFGGTLNNLGATPRRQLGDLVTPLDERGRPDPKADYIRTGASTIYREQGHRLIAVKFSVRDRDLAGTVAQAQRETAHLFPATAPYHAVWSGEFEEMQQAEGRLLWIVPVSLGLILVLLYIAFRSLLDSFVVLSNVLVLSMGGIWALWLSGTHFSISAAVGFVSLFGVAIMDGLLMISYFNQHRAAGLPVEEAILLGAEKRMRPMMMADLAAILGLLPAALALRPAWDAAGSFRWVEQIGSQTQRPLAIVVVGGMLTTLLLTRYLMPVLYSFYGRREPRPVPGGLGH
ncbi:MAG: efflux RND transporter permease subunit [Thermoguttaceae bacterium]|jgi:cobalt-zinc-cadmium resistance protein CzcA